MLTQETGMTGKAIYPSAKHEIMIILMNMYISRHGIFVNVSSLI